jgi:hypothetical protein
MFFEQGGGRGLRGGLFSWSIRPSEARYYAILSDIA